MLGDLFNNNKRKDVCTREGQKLYMGKKYAIEKETGYLVCTTGKRERLHIVKYREEVLGGKEVPPGYVIHHKDWNKTNNDIKNLVCITVREHELIHTPPRKGTETEEDLKLIKKLKEMGLINN